jgi:FlaA1/EpsC-like NDP-sugar epimerase
MNRLYRLAYSIPRFIIVLHDMLVSMLVWLGLKMLLAGVWLPLSLHGLTELFIVAGVQICANWLSGLYRGIWRFASHQDLVNIFRAAIGGSLAIALIFFLSTRHSALLMKAFFLYLPSLVFFLCTPRLLYRLWKNQRQATRHADATRVLIVGASQVAEIFLRDLQTRKRYQAIGILDDDPTLKGRMFFGTKVLGAVEDLASLAKATNTELCVIALAKNQVDAYRRVVTICDELGLPFRKLGQYSDWLDVQDSAQLNEVAIDDLLGREPIAFDWQRIREQLRATTVLITGAGGSIGSELARQCAQAEVKKIIVMDRNELALLDILEQLKSQYPQIHTVAVLGDCGDRIAAMSAMRHGVPDYVYHAAANKHVPFLQNQLREALRNNVDSTATLASVCKDMRVQHFVLISTDKAVKPVNVLGASKLMAERACQSIFEQSSTQLSIARFGNVLDSSGSVVPIFKKQISAGGPVTVTHPEVSRYFMTIPEACQLILQALSLPEQNTVIYTLDMGEPILIRELAEQMIRLAGKRPGVDIMIEFSGLRPGEKLHEELVQANEMPVPSHHPRIMETVPKALDTIAMDGVLDTLSSLLRLENQDAALQSLLKKAVPEYTPHQAPGSDQA